MIFDKNSNNHKFEKPSRIGCQIEQSYKAKLVRHVRPRKLADWLREAIEEKLDRETKH